MRKSKEARKASEQEEIKREARKLVNDIIQKIVDAHSATDQSLADISSTCRSREECEGN